ncbi:MAG: hypothetical protein ACI4IK_03735 [Eubacterium sp.]
MKTKAKKFSHKLLALFMAVVMALTCFTGVLTAFGASNDVKYNDSDVEYNSLAWKVLSDEQTATALLDYADVMLKEYGPVIDRLLSENLPTSGIYSYNKANRTIDLEVPLILSASIKVYTHSVDELMETLESVNSLLESKGGLVGTLGKIDLSPTNGMRRSNTSSCDIIRAVLGILQNNFSTYNNNSGRGVDPIGDILRGDLTLGTLGTFVSLDVYGMIGNLLGCKDGYESDMIYNIAQALIFNYTKWYTEDEIAAFNSNPSTWVYDDELIEKLTTELLDKISVLVTYDESYTDKATDTTVMDNSATRYAEIKEYMTANSVNYATAADALGYDPNLVYSDEFVDNDGNYQNVLLFAYGSPDDNGLATASTNMVTLSVGDSLFDFGFRGLQMAWDTVLKDTVKLVHVNNDVNRGHGSNFDNEYYYWLSRQSKDAWTGDPAVDYTADKVEAWFEAVYADYGAADANEFKGWVQHNFEFDRTAAADSEGKWSDIDETTLFNKLRYSPLADYYFNMQTGPINLYFLQLGTPNLDAFFANDYANYSSMAAALNDCLVAAVKDLFPTRDNINGTTPTLATTGNMTSVGDEQIRTITSTLVANALKVVQYVADATDANILKAFYNENGEGAALSEQTLEAAMMPMLIACIGQVNLGSGKLERVIHPEDWDACKDAEAVAFVCLREYLSYILPDKDYNVLATFNKDAEGNVTKIVATLDGTILPMARDAVSYVMQGYVPVNGKDGNAWDVYDRAVDDESTLLDLLNSVVCYYGGDYSVKDGNRAMGVGALLGACDASNGNSTITTDNTIWQNIDIIANKLMPMLGGLQYGFDSTGTPNKAFSSEDLIWNDIVLGVLEIGDNSIHSSGMYGVSNFLYKLLTIIASQPIQNDSVVVTIYNFLADLLNGLFGARYESLGQGYITVVTRVTRSESNGEVTYSSLHPFDDLFHKAQIVGASNGDAGALQKLVDNFVEFAGYGTSGVATYPDSILRGICFALQAVQSFIPEAIKNIGDHSLELATSEFAIPTVTGAQAGTVYTSDVTITNNSTGINNAYIDGMNNGNIVQQSRYYLKVKSATITNEDGCVCSVTTPSQDLVAPWDSLSVSASTTYSGTDTSFEVAFTYDICLEDGTVLYSDLTSTCYKYITKNVSWADTVYPQGISGRYGYLAEGLETNSANSTTTLNGYNAYTSSTFLNGDNTNVLYPEYFVLESTNIAAINGYYVRFRNNGSSDRGMDGIYTYDTKDVYNDGTSATVSVTNANAIPVFDKETGDLIKYGTYDYSLDGGDNWVTNYKSIVITDYASSSAKYNAGFTSEEIASVLDGLTDAQKNKFRQRPCHVFTLEEAKNAGIIAAYHLNEKTNLYDYIYLQTNGSYSEKLQSGKTLGIATYTTYYPYRYDTLLGLISMRGPVDGLYIPAGKSTIEGGKSQYVQIFAYDNETEIQAGSYPVNVACYSSTKTGYIGEVGNPGKPCTILVADTTSKGDVDTKYRELSKLLANYEASDFTDYDEAAGESAKQIQAKQALVSALAAEASVVTVDNADELSDNRYLAPTTSTTTSEYGDLCYVPFFDGDEASIPAKVLAEAFLNEEDGIYYFDEAHTMPIYSPVELTPDDLDENGKSLYCGEQCVVVTDENGNKSVHLKNTAAYETEWDTETYLQPWLKNTDVQATDSNDNLLYNQVQFVYRDAKGDKCTSKDEWACKFPATEYKIIENEGTIGSVDNRGIYTQAVDLLTYTINEVVSKFIDTSAAESLFTKITLARTGLNNNNFEVLTFNKMTKAAQAAERQFSVIINYTDPTTKEAKETEMWPAAAASFIDDLANKGVEYTTQTKSSLSAVQVREYLRLYELFLSKVVERGYLGDQLEAEIVCASGNPYSAMTATVATYNEDGTVATPASVSKTASAVAPTYGAWDANGNLVNEGATVYSQKTWDAYVTALAKAIDVATTGNSASYTHKTADYVELVENKTTGAKELAESYTAQNSTCYSVDTALQTAEIALTPSEAVTVTVTPVEGTTATVDGVAYSAPVAYEKGDTVSIGITVADGYTFDYLLVNGEKVFVTEFPYDIYLEEDVTVEPVVTKLAPTGITVSGTIMIATDATGTTYTKGLSGISIVANGEVVATSASDGTFTATVPAGTTELTITGDTSIDRTVTLAGDADVTGAVIPLVMCDYNKDKVVNATDLTAFLGYYSGDYYVYADFNVDSNVNAADLTSFLGIYGNDVNYAALTIA